jgi:hypothetical protein
MTLQGNRFFCHTVVFWVPTNVNIIEKNIASFLDRQTDRQAGSVSEQTTECSSHKAHSTNPKNPQNLAASSYWNKHYASAKVLSKQRFR